MGRGVAVVALGEVPVVAGDYGVGDPVVEVLTVPLADTGPISVGQHLGAQRLEVGQQAVSLDGGPDLLGARGDE